MKISELVNVSIGLSVTPASQASFNVPLLLVDHADVPIYQRYRIMTRSDYATELTAASTQLNWCAALWGQNYNPAQAYIGRWVSADSNPLFICGDHETTVATWAGVSDGCCTVTTTAGADILAALNFAAVTSIADVALVIDTALVAGGTSGARCAVDALDNIVFTDAGVTGAGADTVVISASGAGTHIELAAWLDVPGGFAFGGLDAEALGTAMSTIFAIDNTPYIVCQRGEETAADLATFSTAVNALDKILMLVEDDTNAKDAGSTTDSAYLINALSHQKTHICYTEHSTANGATANQHPDAATIGEILSRLDKEGTVSLALNPLSGVSESGLHNDNSTVIPLTTTERTALEAKGCDYLIKPSSLTHLRNGLAAGGNEVRVMIGKAFMAAKCSEEIYEYLVANEVVTFSDDDIQAMKAIVEYWAEEMADRKLLDRDSFVWNFPAAADFPAAQKATHTMTLSDVFSADVQSAVNDIVLTMSFSI